MMSSKIIIIYVLVVIVHSGLTCLARYEEMMNCGKLEDCLSDSYLVQRLESFRNREFNACDDFYEYSFGNIQADCLYGWGNIYEVTNKRYMAKMEKFLDKYIHKDESTENIRNLLIKLSTYNGACNTVNAIEVSTVLNALPEMPSVRWPNWTAAAEVSEWNEPNFKWITAIAELRRYGLNRIFFEERVAVAFNDSDRYVVELRRPSEDVRDEIYVKPRIHLSLAKIIKDYTLMNLRLESRILNFKAQYEALRRTNHSGPTQILTLGELKLAIPNIDWQTYFNSLLQQTSVREDLPIQLHDPEYYRSIGTLLDQSDDTVVNFYILLRLIVRSHSILNQELVGTCQEQFRVLLSPASNYFYERFFLTNRESDEATLQAMLDELKAQFLKNLQKNYLNLSPAELEYVKGKLQKMRIRVGNMPRNKPVEYFNNYYDGVNITQYEELSYWHNHWQVMQLRTKEEHAKLFENQGHVDSDSYFVYEDPHNSHFMPYFLKERNWIMVPQQFLLPPYYGRDMSKVFQQSLTGFALARAVAEAFVPSGIYFDGDGHENELGSRILQKSAALEAIHCSQNKSERFPLEFLIDVAALQLVVDTYFDGVPTGEVPNIVVDGPAPKMREVFFTHLAKYFAGYNLYVMQFLKFAGSEPYNVRLNNAVSHIQKFGETFDCAVGSAENPEKKCPKLW